MRSWQILATVARMSSRLAKAEWRSVAKRLRVANSPDRVKRDRGFVLQLERWLASSLDQGGVVVLFDAMSGEADLAALKTSELLRGQNISFAITRTPEVGFDLTVHPVSVRMEQHRFGYRQPVEGSEQVSDSMISVVLVPALAYDGSGNRLGFGAGYYDRFLARVPLALKVGIADVLVGATLPTEQFDIPMTHLATPDGIASVSS